jgi:probable rRNA maturation factor
MRDRPPSRQTPGRADPADGSSEVLLVDQQGDDARRRPVDVARWSRLANAVLAAEGVGGGAELSLLYVDEVAMADLNALHLGGDGPTDVLAFPIDDDVVTAGPSPDGVPRLLGDVVICPAVAERNAPTHAGSYGDELALLLVHGVLHLLGHDHDTEDDRGRMQGRERDLLARFHGPLAADPWSV